MSRNAIGVIYTHCICLETHRLRRPPALQILSIPTPNPFCRTPRRQSSEAFPRIVNIHRAMEVQPEASQKNPPQVSRSFRLRSPSLNTVRLRRIFETFDGNGDGKITAVELGQALQRLGLPVPAPELELTIDGFLRQGTDGLDFDGFAELHRSLGDNLLGGVAEESGAKENGNEEEDLKEAFRVFDEDGDGFISAAELQGVLRRLGLADADDVERMIENVDENRDGLVDFLEFKHMMTQSVTVKSS